MFLLSHNKLFTWTSCLWIHGLNMGTLDDTLQDKLHLWVHRGLTTSHLHGLHTGELSQTPGMGVQKGTSEMN